MLISLLTLDHTSNPLNLLELDVSISVKILDTEYAIEDYAIAIAKDNTELLDKINAALEKLTEDGKIDEIIAKYISINNKRQERVYFPQ